MAGFFKAAAIVMSGGATVGAGALAILPDEQPAPAPSAAGLTSDWLPKVSPAPCKRPLWPNSPGACQGWTLPQRDVEGLLASERARGAADRERQAHGKAQTHTARADTKKGTAAQAGPRMASHSPRGTMASANAGWGNTGWGNSNWGSSNWGNSGWGNASWGNTAWSNQSRPNTTRATSWSNSSWSNSWSAPPPPRRQAFFGAPYR
jgi:hypothetical protein